MSNHVHLLLRERTESISISLKRLAVSYAAYYNKRYQRVGLRGHWHLEHPTDLQKKERMERNEILVEAIQYGIPPKTTQSPDGYQLRCYTTNK